MKRVEVTNQSIEGLVPAEDVDRFLAVATFYTGVFMCSLSKLYEYAEELLGRPVMTHEFGDAAVMRELKERSRQEFTWHLRQFHGVEYDENKDREGDASSNRGGAGEPGE